MSRITRRHFVKSSALVAGSLAISHSRVLGANNDLRIAVVGLRSRGKSLIKDVVRTDGARLVALCDVDSAILDERVSDVESEHGIKVRKYVDYREVLDQADIDAVVLTTPNHWHALQTIWACQAGKDVYVEKPVCHSVWEGRRMIDAARKYNRIVQPGFQNRSDVGLLEAFPWIMAGNLGEIKMVRGLCYRNRESIGKIDTPLIPPETVDYDLWLGPADDLPMHRPRFHYDWHWVYNTGNGDVGNQGPHEMDLIRWILGDPGHPKGVVSFGGRFGWNDAGETANMQMTSLDWGDIPVLFEVKNLWINPETNAAANYKGRRVGVIITCEGGEFRGGRGGGIVYDNDGKKIKSFKGDGGYGHFPAFVKGVKSRKESDLAITLEEGFKSSCLSHLANASLLSGQEVTNDELIAFASKDEHLGESLERCKSHLAAWSVDNEKEPWSLGVPLKFNGKREQFKGPAHQVANSIIIRKGRDKYAIPAKV